MPFIEAPTTFYMGRRYDPSRRQLVDEVVYYDSRDLTTHAVVVGMTGSGKTGLCIDLLEEAVLDNIPAIVIDPKGDITNLLLTFPNLQPADFAPWINVDEAQRAGLSVEEYARDVAQQWRDGLSSWSIVPQRIAAMKNAAQFSIYTPGSDAGLPVSILDSLRAPREGWEGNEEGHRERISGMVTALMALIGRQVEPVKDREHVLISNIFEYAWRNGRDLSLEDIILQVQKPPFAKLGVFDVDTFFPEKDRFKLAMELNNIIAAPSFQSWINGEPLDISNLLYTPEGRPRVSIFYVAHLTEAERNFMITLILENMLAWMRTLSGTTSLRAVLYFDEVFGHFPPYPRNPPTKEPLLRLLKQARAFGIGLVLATQNPADLDYKGLSNAGTWFIGKLQTDNDKSRVLGGLQAAANAQNKLDVNTLDRLLSSIDPRVFVLHNVHDEGGPILMHSRWSMSYLRGPLTRQQIRALMEPQRRALRLVTATLNAVGSQPMVTSAPPSQPIQPSQPAPAYVAPAALPPEPPITLPPASPARKTAVEPAVPAGSTPVPPSLPEADRAFKPSGPLKPPTVTGQFKPSAAPPPAALPESDMTPEAKPLVPPYTPPQPAQPVQPAYQQPASPYEIPAQPDQPYQEQPYAPAAPQAAPYEIPAQPAQPYVEPSYPVNPAPLEGSTVGLGIPRQQPSVPAQATSLTQRGPSLPEGYGQKPIALPSSVPQFFLPTITTTQQAIREWEQKFGYQASSFGGAQLLYKPVLLAQVAVRYLDRKTSVDESQRWAFQVPNVEKSGLVAWGEYQATSLDPKQVSSEPFGEAFYGTPSPGLVDSKRMTALKGEVVDYIYRSATLTLFYNTALDIYGSPRDNRRDFLLKIQQKAREARDAEIDQMTQRYDKELEKLDEKLRKELRDMTYDKQVLDHLKREDLYTTGEAVLGLLKGRTSYTLSRMSRTRRYKTQAQERAVSGEHAVANLEDQIEKKQQELQNVLRGVNDKWSQVATTVEETKLTPYKKDIVLEIFGIGWIPNWYSVLNGQAMMLPAFNSTRT